MIATHIYNPIPDFLGSEIISNIETAQVAILPIPFEATTTYRKGCQNGPAALLEASDQLECYDTELEQEVCFATGIYTHPPIADTRNQIVSSEEMLKVTQKTVYELAKSGKFVIALGGEHSITAGVVAGYQQLSDEPFTVVQIDAHGDLRYEYEGSIHNHACVMRRIVEQGIPTVQVGIRSICLEEAHLIKEKQLSVFWAQDIATQTDWVAKVIAAIPTKRVFLTIDLDGLDPSSMPGVGTPQPGGLSWYGLLTFLRHLFTTHTVIGCDVMELAPIVDCVVSEFTAAKLTYKLIGYSTLVQVSSQ
ncbi:MAG: agmatinase [Cyanobacteria bacterium J06592_8]